MGLSTRVPRRGHRSWPGAYCRRSRHALYGVANGDFLSDVDLSASGGASPAPQLWPHCPATALGGSTVITKRIDDQGQRGRQLSTTRIVEVVTGEGRAPVSEHADESPCIDVFLDHVFWNERYPEPASYCLETHRQIIKR